MDHEGLGVGQVGQAGQVDQEVAGLLHLVSAEQILAGEVAQSLVEEVPAVEEEELLPEMHQQMHHYRTMTEAKMGDVDLVAEARFRQVEVLANRILVEV